ncbi:MAG: hypothetical protein AAF696_31420 [Bacteroidota bacterium]
MKKYYTLIFLLSLLFFIPKDMHAQEKESPALVCSLSSPELIQRKADLQREIFSQIQKVKEEEKGYRFSFAYEENFLPRLVDYMLAEKKCCPFFRFELIIEEGKEGLELVVSGPKGAKAMIAGLIEE